MKVTEFDYFLPKELIAQKPAQRRDKSRLMVVHRDSGKIEDRIFSDFPEYLEQSDCLVYNNTRVIPARLFGTKKEAGGKVEILLLNEIEKDKWEILVRPGRRVRIGTEIIFKENLLKGVIEDRLPYSGRIISFQYEKKFPDILKKIGVIPLPPYIHGELKAKERYQTIYARENGSAAAPTAGLHFTEGLLKKIENKGVRLAPLTLHIGYSTFTPVKEENVENHQMYREYFFLSSSSAKLINGTKGKKGSIIAVGTTSVRVLEYLADVKGQVKPASDWTDCFIYPGYQFEIVDKMLTNFHLPRSTLIMLVSAFAGVDLIKKAYQIAIEKRYRFYSFGDAMLII